MKNCLTKPSAPTARWSNPCHSTTLWLLALLCVTPIAVATPDKNANCRACHNDEFKGGMFLTNFQRTTNVGPDVLKIYQVLQGEAASIRVQVTNGYAAAYGLSLLNLDAPGSTTSSNRLVYTGDRTWVNRIKTGINWFTVGPVYDSPTLTTHNLAIANSTPPDLYLVQMQMAGSDVDSYKWSQVEDFYIEVLRNTAPAPQLTVPTYASGQFSVNVATVSGYTYYLEYNADLNSAAWSVASQTAGDGTVKTLTHTNPVGPQQFYRVRVQ